MTDLSQGVALERAAPLKVDCNRRDVDVRVETGLGIAKLRICGCDAQLRFGEITGTPPPGVNEQLDLAGLAIAGLAPGEWMVTGPEAKVRAWTALIEAAEKDDVLAVEITDARVSFLVSGREASAVIASHCPLDLGDDAFPAGTIARSLFAETGMFIERLSDTEDEPCFRIIVDQAMAPHAARMLAAG